MQNILKTKFKDFAKIHPLFDSHNYDKYGFPILNKDNFSESKLNNISVTNLKNINGCPKKETSIVLMFNEDEVLESLWKNPFNPLIHFQGFYAICTPDFSIYEGMNENIIRYNVFRNRWYGCFLQDKGFKVIPTIQWCDPNTFDICFSGLPKGSVIAISTLGCKKNKEKFLEGFKEMYERISPSLIICFGGIIQGMFGKILLFSYEDSFNQKNKKYKQIELVNVSRIIEIKKEII